MPREEAEPKVEASAADEASVAEPEAEGAVETEGGVEGTAVEEAEPKKRSHHKKADGTGSSETREPRSRKGSFVDDFMKSAKKVHPVYWVLGLGGAALAIDYFMEGDKSVASSLYRGLFGGKADAGEGGGNGASRPIARAVPMTAIPGASYAAPYYPAFPPPMYAAPRYPGYAPGYAPGYGGRPGFGYGGRGGMGYGGHGGHGGHVRGQFPWE
jgi:hypothetical protein